MKIWSKSVLALVAGTMVFSGCLENIEPEGLKDLRGAKAELLRAKTALEEANAAKVNAEAAFVQAQVKIQEAIAKQEEAKAAYEAAVARLKELEAEKAAAMDAIEIEMAMAEAKAEIARWEKEAAVYAAELERALLLIQAQVVEAQAAYEDALKDLAIAKNTLTPEQAEAVSAMEDAVSNARDEVETKTKALEAAAKQLATMLAEVDEAKINKAVFALAEREVVKAKAALEGAQEAEAEAKEALELDPSVTDWEAKVEEYEAEVEKIRSEYYKRNGEVEDAMASMRDSASATGVIGKMAAEYTAYTGYEFDEETGFFSKVPGTPAESFDIPEVYVTAPVDEEGNAITGVSDFNIWNAVTPQTKKYTYDKEDVYVEHFEKTLKELSKINSKYYETQIAIEEAKVAAAKDDPQYKYDVQKYNDAVKAYTDGDVVGYYKKYVFDDEYDFDAAVKEYNDALKAMEAAVKNFNDNYDKYNPDYSEEYDAALATMTNAYAAADIAKAAAYQKAEDDTKYTYYTTVVKPAAESAWSAAQTAHTTAVYAAETAAGTDKATMEAWITANPDPTTDADKATHAKYTAALDEIEKADMAKTNAEATHNTAKTAWTKAETDYKAATDKADEACEKAKTDADKAYAEAMDKIAAKTPTFDATYMDNLYDQVDAAKKTLQEAVEAIDDPVKRLSGKTTVKDVTFEMAEPEVVGDVTATYVVTSVPEAMTTVTVDKNGTTYAMKAAVVADVVDKEAFKDDVVAVLADALTKVGTKSNNDYADYPLALPSAEECYDFYTANKAGVSPGDVSTLYADAVAEDVITGHKATIEALKQLPDFVKAIEAAQAEFEALVKENADKLAADKAEVEAFYAEYLELEDKYTTELEAIVAKADVVIARYNAMIEVIAIYCIENGNMAATDVDALVERLQGQYEDALATVINAEQAVIDAEKTIEDLKAGVVSAADAAQRAYDRAAEELAEAIAKLERAAKALENVVAAIYDTGEVPETPETPEGGEGETPETGDDTTGTEGGDDATEGGEGEAEGGEGAE